MRTSQTAVLERLATLEGELITEPFEVGWAAEARWFIRLLDCPDEATKIAVTVQVSPDGVLWCDHETAPVHVENQDLVTIPVTSFAGWLRLKIDASSDTTGRVIIYLHLKS